VNLDVPFNVFQEEDDVEVPPASPPLGAQRSGASPDAISATLDMVLKANARSSSSPRRHSLRGSVERLRSRTARHTGDLLAERLRLSRHDRSTVAGFIGPQWRVSCQSGRPATPTSSSPSVPASTIARPRRGCRLFMELPARKLIHVDVDPEELGRNYPPDIGILADARTFLRQLLGELDHRKSPADGALRAWHAEIKGGSRNGSLHPAELRHPRNTDPARARGRRLPGRAAGQCDPRLRRRRQSQLVHAVLEVATPADDPELVGFSGMGFGAAGALGAKLAAPDRPVVAIAGDGCFSMVPHVLCTAVEYNIPVVWVIWNNFAWASIRDIQYGMFGGRELGTAFYQGANQTPYNPDFAAWARASGVDAMTVTKSEDFKGALEHAVKANKPFLLDVHVDANVRPPATGAWQLPPTPYNEPVFGKRWVPGKLGPAK